MDFGYNYLLQEREFIKTKEPVYKIGRTNQIKSRFHQYPNGTQLIRFVKVTDQKKSERKLICVFKELFKHRTDIGSEYFEGPLHQIINAFENTVQDVDGNFSRTLDMSTTKRLREDREEDHVVERSDRKRSKCLCGYEARNDNVKLHVKTCRKALQIQYDDLKTECDEVKKERDKFKKLADKLLHNQLCEADEDNNLMQKKYDDLHAKYLAQEKKIELLLQLWKQN